MGAWNSDPINGRIAVCGGCHRPLLLIHHRKKSLAEDEELALGDAHIAHLSAFPRCGRDWRAADACGCPRPSVAHDQKKGGVIFCTLCGKHGGYYALPFTRQIEAKGCRCERPLRLYRGDGEFCGWCDGHVSWPAPFRSAHRAWGDDAGAEPVRLGYFSSETRRAPNYSHRRDLELVPG